MRYVFKILAAFLLIMLISCDLEGRKNCAWVLEPEPDLIGKTDAGYIPVCARNRTSGKQDCRLQTTLKQAESWQKRMFRYVDLKVQTYGIPRTIESIIFCDGT